MADSPDRTAGTADVTVTAENARKTWAEVISGVQYGGHHTVITRNGKKALVMVPVDWYEKHAGHPVPDGAPEPTKRA